jgi:glutamate N-acetyltransferase/amino-acid N-acetyltransferase
MATHPRSPLAPDHFPDLPKMAGVRFSVACSGMRYQGRNDVTLMELAPGTTIAGVFTRSLTASPPVLWCRKQAKAGKVRAIVVNAGNANTFTGKAGAKAVEETAAAAAKLLGCKKGEVFASSTGVIGVKLPVDKLVATLPAMTAALSKDAWADAAQAIMTTDTFPKGATRTARIGGTTVTISGFCKGSGMIAPDMATMLAYVFTDAKLPAPVLRSLLTAAADKSFNCMTVDGDTSTSDTLLLCATGQAKHKRVAGAGDKALADFRKRLDEVMIDLAQQVARDGEGAQKFVTVRVKGAANPKAARKIAMSIANSPLVKTAIAAADANWGRIVMAVGKAGEKADRDRLEIRMGGVLIAAKGEAVEGYDEAPVTKHMQGQNVDIDVDLKLGKGAATVWTCDLTHGYIDINGSYRS